MARRVSSRQSPHLSCFYQHFPALICIDTGAESNLISEAFAKKVGIPIKPTTHMAAQADGQSMLCTVGETRNVQLSRGAHVFNFDALIIRDLGSDIIVGEPFLEKHDIGVRSARKQIIIKGRDVISYAQHDSLSSPITRHIFTFLCRAPTSNTTILPGEFISVEAPGSFTDNDTVVIEPRVDSHSSSAGIWPRVQLTSVIGGQIHVPNDSDDPILLKKNDHFCQIRTTTMISASHPPQLPQNSQLPPSLSSHTPPSGFYSDVVTIDPQNQLSPDWHEKFTSLHHQFDSLFHPSVGCYNDASGRVRACVNLGSVIPPTKKLHVPNYSQSNLQLLQARFDELEAQGVFARPEDVNVIYSKWYPCEIEALSIATSVRHFGPYLRQSQNLTQILTDNKPCVQAWSKMVQGEFSTSSRVATFMSVLAEYHVDVQHIRGALNLPSDFHSRNSLSCNSSGCQVCQFIADSESCVVRKTSVEDVLSGHVNVPYTTRSSWHALQRDCPDLRRVHAYLSQGTRPTNKTPKITTVKRYLRKLTIGKDGLLVVSQTVPFLPTRELIVVPQHVLPGILTSLHLHFNHPSTSQLQKIFHRAFFALNADTAISSVFSSCTHCQSLLTLPKELHLQSTSAPVAFPSIDFACDIMRRNKQYVFVLRDTFSSFTSAMLLLNEDHISLRKALLLTVSAQRASPQTPVVVRVDNAPGFQSLRHDTLLQKHHISLDFGRVKNVNCNPIAEKAVRELGSEILRFNPDHVELTDETLALITSQLNSRIRNHGLSAWEILRQRDQCTGLQLPFFDEQLAHAQLAQRQSNHIYSSKHKARGGSPAKHALVHPGSLVFVKSEGDKTGPRQRYIVTAVDGEFCFLKKFVNCQLRSRSYKVKLTEIFPVNSDILEFDGAIRGLSINDSDSDDCILPASNTITPVASTPPILNNSSLSTPLSFNNVPEEQSLDPVSNNVDEQPCDPRQPADMNDADEHPRRPVRQRRKPAWMLSGDFEL